MHIESVYRIILPMLLGAAVLAAPAARAQTATGAAAVIAAKGDPAHGVPPCASCHGDHGQGNATAGFPRLAGLPVTYLRWQLEDFADGSRHNAMMQPVARTLDAGQRQQMAAYYAALPPPSQPAPVASALSAQAVTLARHGRAAEGLPGCELCHGRGGVGIGTRFPALAGQSAVYIANQLRAWKHGQRPPGPLGLMAHVAAKLSDADIRAVSTYFAAQPVAGGNSP